MAVPIASGGLIFKAGLRMLRSVIYRHPAFLSVFIAGTVLRTLTWVAYKPVILVLADSNGYLRSAISMSERKQLRPALYPAFIKGVLAVDSLSMVAALQHLLILLLAIGLYAFLLRLSLHPVLAAVGVTPLLIEPYQINLEQHIAAEALFEVLSVGGVLLLAWRLRASVLSHAGAGALIAMGALTRFVGLAVLPVALLYLVARRVGWLHLAAASVGMAVPLVSYAAWNQSQTGSFALTTGSGYVIYATKVARFARCAGVAMPEVERQLCIAEPPAQRAKAYPLWAAHSPLGSMSLPGGVEKEAVVQSFVWRMIRHQPVDYLRVAATDFSRFFSWRSPLEQEPLRASRWHFFQSLRQVKAIAPPLKATRGSPPPEYGLDERFRVDEDIGSFLRKYQRYVYQYGFLTAALMVLGLLGAVFGLGSSDGRDLRLDCLLLTATGLSLYLFPALLATFHYRYVIPIVPLAGPSGVLGYTLISNRVRRTWQARKQ